jgi:hypothetical protein
MTEPDRMPTTAGGWLAKALHFIDTHPDGWPLYPGQDFHGWLLLARRALEEEQSKAVKMINAAMRIGGKAPDMMADVPKERTAEDERRDAVAFLRAEAESLAQGETYEDDDIATRRATRVAELNYMIRHFERGDHVGSATR